MAISKKQEELDKIKWYIGEELGDDPCGTFAYCDKCKKDEENPCEKALKRHKDSVRKKEKRNNKQSKQTFGNMQFRATMLDEK